MVYHEVMVSWVKTMHFISSSNRVISRSNIFGGNAKTSEARLAAEIEALERQVGCDNDKVVRDASEGAPALFEKYFLTLAAILCLFRKVLSRQGAAY